MTEGNAAVRRIRTALSFTKLPCSLNVYDGTEDTYFVLNVDTHADNFADDGPQHDRHLVQVHLFAPFTRNTMSMAKMGMKYYVWAKMKTEPNNARPTYFAGKVMGKMVSVNVTISNSEGELYADDMKTAWTPAPCRTGIRARCPG